MFCSFGEGGLSFVGVLCIGAFTVKAYVHILPVIDFAMKCFINLPTPVANNTCAWTCQTYRIYIYLPVHVKDFLVNLKCSAKHLVKNAKK